MKKIIFYSWQSDLPNRTNREFIESCIKKAISTVYNSDKFGLELNLDRDTKDETGTPDIVNTIFRKIDKCDIFISDISIINSEYNGKKLPNPNVLVELGYAANALGWEKIICIFNTDYGKFEDLPFDLRSRKLITYSTEKVGKSKSEKLLSKLITDSIDKIESEGLLESEIDDYLKVQIDTEIL
jgi:hypothetical protein